MNVSSEDKLNDTTNNAAPPLSLLLLPDPPSEATLTTFRAAYEAALSQALASVSSKSSAAQKGGLDVGLSCSDALATVSGRPRADIYHYAQHVIGLIYRLGCIICTEKKVDVLYDNDVDISIFLIGSDTRASPSTSSDVSALLQGPIIEMATLGLSQKSWRHIYSIESEEGEEELQKFLAIRSHAQLSGRNSTPFTIERLTGGPAIKFPANLGPYSLSQGTSSKHHYSVAVGGTFDHLHAGHKLLLTATALILEPTSNSRLPNQRCLTIGITGDELLKKKKFAEVLESWEDRQSAVHRFLSNIISFAEPAQAIVQSERFADEGSNGRAVYHKLGCGTVIKCVEISDSFGPTITDESITALVISGETRSGGQAVNEKRRDKGWPELAVFEVDVLDAESRDEIAGGGTDGFQSKISSTEIRRKLHEKNRAPG